MLKSKSILSTGRILGLIFVLFALSPCVVKGMMLSSDYAEYAKPLNKTKTTSTVELCSFSQEDSAQSKTVNITKLSKDIHHYDVVKSTEVVLRKWNKTHGNNPKILYGKILPRYILYKRLKLDVA